jgi:hypothetical protein
VLHSTHDGTNVMKLCRKLSISALVEVMLLQLAWPYVTGHSFAQEGVGTQVLVNALFKPLATIIQAPGVALTPAPSYSLPFIDF